MLQIRGYQEKDLEVLKTLQYRQTDLDELAFFHAQLSIGQAVEQSIEISTEVLIVENEQGNPFGVVGVAQSNDPDEAGIGILWGLFTEELKNYKREWITYDRRVIDWLSQGYSFLANWTLQSNPLLKRLKKIGFTVTTLSEQKGIVFFWKEVKEGD